MKDTFSHAGLAPALALGLSLGACASTGGLPPPGTADGPRVFDLAVTVHPLLTSNPTETEIDRIAAAASDVLTNNDVPCATTLRRRGLVTRLPLDFPLIMQSQQDFERLTTRQPGEEGRIVRIVQGITWCGFTGDNIIGCASIPGNVLVVQRFVASMEGQLWAHEFGHNRGLDHADVPTRVMFGSISEQALQKTSGECAAYRDLAAATTGAPRFPLPQRVDAEAIPADVDSFVRRIYPHTFPVVAASRFGTEEVLRILPLLADPAAKPYWSNVVLTAGAAGGPGTAEALSRFLLSPDWNPGDPSEVSAKASVPIAMGYLSNRLNDQPALNFLLERSRPGAWISFAARAGSPEAQLGLQRQMVQSTLQGLSVSGRPAAQARLEAMQRTLRQTDRPVLPTAPGAATAGPEALARESRILQDAIDQSRRAGQGLQGVRQY